MSLSLPLPLRDSTVLPGYLSVVLLPHRYGRGVGGPCVPMDATGLRWLWADHAVQGVDSVTVDDAPIADWQLKNTVDKTGHAIAQLEFGQPQDVTSTVIATGRGKIDAVSGLLIENPADAVFDILTNLAGESIAPGQLAAFRAECGRRNLSIAGSIEQADTAQTVVRALCASIGAIFCGDSPRLCRVFPGGDSLPASKQLALPSDFTLTATSRIEDVFNDVTIQFQFVNGEPKRSVRLTEAVSIQRFGRRVAADPIQATWISAESIAIDLGQRMLAQNAMPGWTVEFANVRGTADVGTDVSITHSFLWDAAVSAMIQTRAWDLSADRSTLDVFLPNTVSGG